MSKINSKTSSIVYSTDPEFRHDVSEAKPLTVSPGQQEIRLHLDRRGGGKVVTIIRGFQGSPTELRDLARSLKKYLGTGGSVKNGEILIQGAVRDQVMKYLQQKQFRVKKSGG